jgi:hypothetical protein
MIDARFVGSKPAPPVTRCVLRGRSAARAPMQHATAATVFRRFRAEDFPLWRHHVDVLSSGRQVFVALMALTALADFDQLYVRPRARSSTYRAPDGRL